jgi:hypothetical protein
MQYASVSALPSIVILRMPMKPRVSIGSLPVLPETTLRTPCPVRVNVASAASADDAAHESANAAAISVSSEKRREFVIGSSVGRKRTTAEVPETCQGPSSVVAYLARPRRARAQRDFGALAARHDGPEKRHRHDARAPFDVTCDTRTQSACDVRDASGRGAPSDAR